MFWRRSTKKIADAMAALQSSEPVAIEALCKSLTHESDVVQGSAMRGLANLGPAARAALPALRHMLSRTNSAESRQVVDETIRAIGRAPN